MLKNVAFTDPQGMHFPNAVFCAIDAEKTDTVTVKQTLDVMDPENNIKKETSTSSYVRVKYAYYVDESVIGNKSCYWLANLENLSEIWVIPNKELKQSKYAGLDATETAELYLKDVILPSL